MPGFDSPIHGSQDRRVRRRSRARRAPVHLRDRLLLWPHRQGFPSLPLDRFKSEWKARGIRRRFHLTVGGCLGPCSMANVVLVQFHGESAWIHSISDPSDVDHFTTGPKRC